MVLEAGQAPTGQALRASVQLFTEGSSLQVSLLGLW